RFSRDWSSDVCSSDLLAEERSDRAATVARQLAADEIERLDAIRTFVDHGNAGIAHELLHAVLDDVAVTAEKLLRGNRVREASVRSEERRLGTGAGSRC